MWGGEFLELLRRSVCTFLQPPRYLEAALLHPEADLLPGAAVLRSEVDLLLEAAPLRSENALQPEAAL